MINNTSRYKLSSKGCYICRSRFFFKKKEKKRGDLILAVRVRNIKQAYLYIKEQDSETALTESAFRSIVKSGLIPTFSIGSRVLLKLDDVDKFLEGVTGNVTIQTQKKGIRKQNVKG